MTNLLDMVWDYFVAHIVATLDYIMGDYIMWDSIFTCCYKCNTDLNSDSFDQSYNQLKILDM